MAACGRERWAVKTLSDAYAAEVSLRPLWTSVGALVALPRPSGRKRRRQRPYEYRTYGVRATLVGFRQETDGDIHVVLRDAPSGETMIAEIPDPACTLAPARLQTAWRRLRTMLQQRYGFAGSSYTAVEQPVVIYGVAFFDSFHHQRGIARNGIELHPVLALKFLR